MKVVPVRAAAAAITLGLSGLIAGPVVAQTQLAQAELSDSKIEAFVVAAVAVEQVRQSYRQEFEETGEEDRAKLAEQANDEMVSAIEATPDITLEEYVEINRARQQDPELNRVIVERYGERLED